VCSKAYWSEALPRRVLAREELALVVAGDGGQVERHEQVGSGSGFQRTGEQVPRVDDALHRLALRVLQHSLERPHVPVDVRKRGEPDHAAHDARESGDSTLRVRGGVVGVVTRGGFWERRPTS
jgi:hypothetical protein